MQYLGHSFGWHFLWVLKSRPSLVATLATSQAHRTAIGLPRGLQRSVLVSRLNILGLITLIFVNQEVLNLSLCAV